jgi:type 1 fimbria pilin
MCLVNFCCGALLVEYPKFDFPRYLIMATLFNIFCTKTRRDPLMASGMWAKRGRRMLAMVACVLGICTTTSAQAAVCSFVTGGLAAANVNFGNVVIPANAAVGSTVARSSTTFGSVLGGATYSCGTSATVSVLMSGAGTSGVYPTNIPGLGVRVTLNGNAIWGIWGTYAAPFSFGVGSSGSFSFGGMGITTELVITAPVSLSGTDALSYNVSPWVTISPASGGTALTVANLSVTGTLALASCSVRTASVSVTLPNVSAGSLNTGSSGRTPFSLGLNCPNGVKVYVTLTDASNVANTSTTLGLTRNSTAAGVGLQILNGANPIAYGLDSAAAGNTNQWSAGVGAGGAMNIPLIAQYVRTGTVTTGTVQGVATFTMSYQ